MVIVIIFQNALDFVMINSVNDFDVAKIDVFYSILLSRRKLPTFLISFQHGFEIIIFIDFNLEFLL